MALALLVIASLATSALSAVAGMGGGIALLAAMAALIAPPLVVPIHGIVQLFSNGTRALVMLPHVNRKIFALYMIPSIAGVLLGAKLYVGSELPWFRPAVGVFILVYLLTLRFEPRLGRFSLGWYAPLGFAIGAVASLIGATGPLVAPFFLRDDLESREIVATKAAIQLTTHAAKIPAFFLAGFRYGEHLGLLLPLVGAAIVGTLVGARVLERLSPTAFRRVFVTVLVVVAIHLIFFS